MRRPSRLACDRTRPSARAWTSALSGRERELGEAQIDVIGVFSSCATMARKRSRSRSWAAMAANPRRGRWPGWRFRRAPVRAGVVDAELLEPLDLLHRVSESAEQWRDGCAGRARGSSRPKIPMTHIHRCVSPLRRSIAAFSMRTKFTALPQQPSECRSQVRASCSTLAATWSSEPADASLVSIRLRLVATSLTASISSVTSPPRLARSRSA